MILVNRIFILSLLCSVILLTNSIASGQCRYFDGQDDDMYSNYLDMPAWWDADKPELTIEFWFRIETSLSATVYIAQLSDSSGGGWYRLSTNGTVFDYSHTTTVTGYVNPTLSGVTFKTGVWYHLADVYDGKRLCIYINGKLNGAPTACTGSIRKNAGVGWRLIRFGRFNTAYGNVSIDEARVWDIGRTEKEIQSNMNFVIADNEPHLKLHLTLDEKAGNPFDRTKEKLNKFTTVGTTTKAGCPNIKRIRGE